MKLVQVVNGYTDGPEWLIYVLKNEYAISFSVPWGSHWL
jgi:hypothetical protein